MTKKNCQKYYWVYTSASNYTKQIKVWVYIDKQTGQTYYFLDNGAECTDLISRHPELDIVYQGGGLMERILGKFIKANSQDIDKIQKTIVYGAAAIAILALVASTVLQQYKTHK